MKSVNISPRLIEQFASLYFGVGVAVGDIDGRIISANQKYCDYLGYEFEEIANKKWSELTAPEDLEASDQQIKKVLHAGKVDNFEKQFIHKRGHKVWSRVSITMVKDPATSNLYFVTAVEDITEFKLANALMKHQKEILELMIQNVPLNETLARIVRFIEEQAPGCLSTIYLIVDNKLTLGAAPSFPESFVTAVNGCPIGPTAGSCGAAAFHGKRIVSTNIAVDPWWTEHREWIMGYGLKAAWSTPVLAKDGRVIGTVSMCWSEVKVPTEKHFALVDIATNLMGIAIERDRNEKLLQEHQLKLISSSKLAALGEMAAGLAHEINNPLAIINLRVDQLKSSNQHLGISKQLTDEIFASIDNTTGRISKIIKGLSHFARDGEQDPLNLISVKSLFEDTLVFCRERFTQNGVSIKLLCPESLKMKCRSVQICQILLNLLNNSFDAVEKLSEKWVLIEAKELGNMIEIAVTDSGNGIPVEIRSHVLQPFFTTKGAEKGTGLGLSISNSIAHSHGGTLTIDDGSKNTRFVLRIPK